MSIIEQTKFWIEIRLPVNDAIEDLIANFLFELGAQGCYNQEDILRVYFHHSDWNEQKYDQFHHYLKKLVDLNFSIQIEKIQVKKVEDQDWNALWKQSVKPIKIEEKILIKPSWIDIKPQPSAKVIEIDPQMAFGTGTHATTQLMLQLLIKYIGSHDSILDMGTGTGILAIAAAKLSNAQIIAFDNDPIATATVQQNSIKNDVLDRINIFCGTIDAVESIQFDLIMANINRSIIIDSLSKIYHCLQTSGLAIFSGVLVEEKKTFVTNIVHHRFNIIDEDEQGEWIGMVVQKDDPVFI